MTSINGFQIGKIRPEPRAFWWILFVSTAVVGPSARSAAQPPPPLPLGEQRPGIVDVRDPERDLPRPLEGNPFSTPEQVGLPHIVPGPPRPVAPFIEGLKANDAAFEVVLGQGRILTTKQDITVGRAQAMVAVGDPSVIDFTILTARQIRITGQRLGVTDLSITSSGGQNFSFNVRVVCDLEPLAAKLKAVFPDANLRLAQLRENIIVGGEARDQAQVSRIMQMTNGYLRSVLGGPAPTGAGSSAPGMSLFPGSQPPSASAPPLIRPNPNNPAMTPDAPSPEGLVSAETNPGSVSAATTIVPEVINLIRVPGSQQVLLKVRVAELNRSALRAIGANFLGVDPSTGAIVGTQLAGPVTAAGGLGSIGPPIIGGRKLTGTANTPTTVNTTVFGIFQDNSFEFTLNAMRTNTMLKVLAEPNLVALHGHLASFLAGGEFPVPVASAGAGGSVPTVNVQFKKFGVQLNFVPLILDGDVIRLSVAPVVSQIDNTISVTLVAGGSAVPGLSTRQAQTTVEMREGQTLAIAGLLQLQLNGTTERIPGLGDLPIIGPFFSNTSSQRIEKELVVLVTPYLIEAMHKDQVTPAPGDEVKDPNDLEVFLLNRIESRTGKDLRATTTWDDPMNLTRLLNLVPKYVNGPSGFSE